MNLKTVLPYSLLVLLCCTAVLWAQDISKKPLSHDDYDRWNTISQRQTSHDGTWIRYTIQSGKIDGDPTLVLRKNRDTKQYKILRARGARFSDDSRFVAYTVAPDPKVVENLKKEEAKPAETPQSRMELLELETGKNFSVERVKSFAFPEENSQWLAYLMEAPFETSEVKEQKSNVAETYEVTPEGNLRRPEKPLKLKPRRTTESENKEETTEKKSREANKEPGKGKQRDDDGDNDETEEKKKAAGTDLVIRNLLTGEERRLPNVTSYRFSKLGNAMAFATSVASGKSKTNGDSDREHKEDSDEPHADGVRVLDLESQKITQIIDGLGNYTSLAFDESGTKLAFITDRDDYKAKTSSSTLYLWKRGSKSAKEIAKENGKGIPEGWWIASTAAVYFSEDSRRLFFHTAPVPESVSEERAEVEKENSDAKKAEDEDDKKPKLDVWHWQDPLLQPQQLIQAERERNRSYIAAYDLKSRKTIQIANKEVPSVRVDPRATNEVAVGVTNLPYRKMMSWDIPGFQDSYLVNLNTGEREVILEKSKAAAQLSPNGNYVTWFDAEERHWYAASTDEKRTPIQISAKIEFPLQNELHDTPSLPRAYGSAGWLKDDEAFLIYDRFDIWQLDPEGKEDPVCVTGGIGREKSIRFRHVELDDEARAIDLKKDMMLSAFDDTTKASGFYVLKAESKDATTKNGEVNEDESRLNALIMLDESFGRLSKAKNSDDVFFSRSTFQKCPDIWGSTIQFKKIHRISDINPQQDEYLWGSVELVNWKATDGQDLTGLLYKPEDFDPTQKYPLMVYFYERNSDRLHSYHAPSAGRSIINFSFYVSRGYVLFVPDIPYKTGEPGPSAANSVIPGTQAIIDMGFIDKDRVGMQGHSWGGYQTAYLVTQTDMFACAESGAPVSNMTSAYGGIRWGSGMSRMFQYERTQSRIGDTLWSAREKYIANSPLFFADKINTPLLILHNDEDGAVPWYQGIELFVAMRRLEKPSWLLNYNGNPHWVMGQPNRRDFALRMQQFFDHYLQNAPEPEWMAYGIPAVEKGEKFGLDLLEPKKEPEKESEPVKEEATEEEATE